MVIWIASYPRSGNSFLRVLLHNLSGLPTYSIYQNESEPSQISTKNIENKRKLLSKGKKLGGHTPLPCSIEEMKQSSEIFFVKTHELPSDRLPTVYLFRDGRDASLSYVKFIQEHIHEYAKDKTETQILKALIAGKGFFGEWSNHISLWTGRGAPTVLIRFEYLINHSNPKAIIEYIFQKLNLNYPLPGKNASLPSFQELKRVQPKLYKSGKVGNWQTKMSPEIHELFWQEHGAVMRKMGYSKEQPFVTEGLDFSGFALLDSDNKRFNQGGDKSLTRMLRSIRLRMKSLMLP